MYLKTEKRPVRWPDRTLSVLRADRLEACGKQLAGMSGCGLFDAECTDADAERLFSESWYAEEDRSPRLHSIEEMRVWVLGRFPAEMALLSPEEHDLLLKLIIFGGSLPVYNWNDLEPALSLVRRMWCRPAGENRLTMPRQLCSAAFVMLASDEHAKLREITNRIVETIDNTLYLVGAMPADAALKDMARQYQGTYAEHSPELHRRLLKASFVTMSAPGNRLTLVHDGASDPWAATEGTKEESLAMIGGDPENLGALYDSLEEMENPVYERLMGLIRECCRPETSPEDTAEDLMLLAKQGASKEDLREVLSTRLTCMVTEEMVDALGEMLARTPRWISLRMNRAQ